MAFVVGPHVIATPQHEGVFPKYRQVIPEYKNYMNINGMLKILKPFAKQEIVMDSGDDLQIKSEDGKLSASEPGQLWPMGRWKFSAKYLTEALSMVGDATMYYGDATRPILLRSARNVHVHVLMPMNPNPNS
jgi:DNA polymerase III sliding clamp (beta) subunit (PCNA family)